MKQKFNILLAAMLVLPWAVSAQKYTKEFHEKFAKSQIRALDITNKFGTIEINDLGGDMVTVDAVITVEKMSEKKANELFDLIKINIEKNGNVLNAETVFAKNFNNSGGGSFSINYKINIPKDRDLKVDNKYGNLILQDLEGNGSFTIGYGNITAGNINTPGNSAAQLDLSYGKADIGTVNNLNGIIKYSKLFAGTVGKITLDSKYSELDVKNMTDLLLESKYDNVRIDEISGIKANSKYTNYNIGKLLDHLAIVTSYGTVRIGQVAPDFTTIVINSSYGSITMGMKGLNYLLDAECSYCEIKYPADRFEGDRIKENTAMRVKGSVGSASAKGNVFVRSRYGEIKLGE